MATGQRNTKQKVYFCYLLKSENESFPFASYVGFTTNPRRRIRQHNGLIKAGAKKTVKQRPWQMVVVVYGFPTKVAALQFEWAWQHPRKSRLVRDVARSRSFKRGVLGRLQILYEMLQLAPWSSHPLHLHFLQAEFQPPVGKSLPKPLQKSLPVPPSHMSTTCGVVDVLPCYFSATDPGDDSSSDSDTQQSSVTVPTAELKQGNKRKTGSDQPRIALLAKSDSKSSLDTETADDSDSGNVLSQIDRELSTSAKIPEAKYRQGCIVCNHRRNMDESLGNEEHSAAIPSVKKNLTNATYRCSSCCAHTHVLCLARFSHSGPSQKETPSGHSLSIIPKTVLCPLCQTDILWPVVVEQVRAESANLEAFEKASLIDLKPSPIDGPRTDQPHVQPTRRQPDKRPKHLSMRIPVIEVSDDDG